MNFLTARPKSTFVQKPLEKVEIYETYNGKDHELLSPWHIENGNTWKADRLTGFGVVRQHVM